MFKLLDGGLWQFSFEDEMGIPVPALTAIDHQPKNAILRCIDYWKAMNGGTESQALRVVLYALDDFFTETGDANPGRIQVEPPS